MADLFTQDFIMTFLKFVFKLFYRKEKKYNLEF